MAKRTQSYGLNNPLQDVFPVPVVADRAPNDNDTQYELGQQWVNRTTAQIFALGNITDGTPTWSILGETAGSFPITPFVVGTSGQAGYTTIQAAIDAATLAGGSNVIWVQPDTYTEDLTITSSITFMNINEMATINGIHTPPTTGAVSFDGFTLISATHILSSAASGTTSLSINNSLITITNGYVFDVPSWTGDIFMRNCTDSSTNNGIINNVSGGGGSDVTLVSSSLGAGSGQILEINGSGDNIDFQSCNINCPVNILGSGNLLFQNGLKFTNTITIGGSFTGFGIDTNFRGGTSQALIFNSSGDFSISNGEIQSTNDPAVGGMGAGTLTLTSIAFPNNANIAATVIVAGGIGSSGTFNTLDQTTGLTISSNDISSDGTDANIPITVSPKGTGDVQISSNLGLTTAATQLQVEGGALTDFIGQTTLAAGTVTVANTNIAATDRIFLTAISTGAAVAIGRLDVSIIASTSFTITSINPTNNTTETNDVSVVNYFIVRQL